MGYFRYLLIPFEAGYVSVFIKIVLFQIMNLVNDSCYSIKIPEDSGYLDL